MQEIFDPRLTQQINLKNKAVGIGYRFHFETSATIKLQTIFFIFSF